MTSDLVWCEPESYRCEETRHAVLSCIRVLCRTETELGLGVEDYGLPARTGE